MRPVNGYMLVRVLEEEQKTSGGIVLPVSAKAGQPRRGEVRETGKGRILESGHHYSLGLSIGDNVLFPQGVGHEIRIENEKHVLLREEDVLAYDS